MLVSWRVFYPMLKESGFLSMENSMNQVIRRVASAQDVPLLDAAPIMPSGPKYFGDFVHFTDSGAEIFSRFVAARLLPYLKADPATSLPSAAVGSRGLLSKNASTAAGSLAVSGEAAR